MKRIPSNVEPSQFRPGEYFGWDGGGQPYRITKHGSQWRALPAANHRARLTAPSFRGKTLTEVAASIAKRGGQSAQEPF